MFAALTVAALFVLRGRGLRAPYRTFGYPATPILFVTLSGWIAYAQVKEHLAESLVVVGVLAVGGLLYGMFGRASAPSSAVLAPLPKVRVGGGDPDAP